MSAMRFLTTTLLLGLTLTTAHAAERDAAIASGAKLTKADAARTVSQPPAAQPDPGPQAQRGIEKKDIRRGMVIAKPGSAKAARPGECPPDCVAAPDGSVTAPRD